MEKLTDKQMRFVCELIWGSIPADKNYKMDRDWIEKTPIFNQRASEILEKYPMLDKSFFNESAKTWKNGKKLNWFQQKLLFIWFKEKIHLIRINFKNKNK